jgi:quercetin dioxygenase-like cupin family protein
MEAHVKMFVAGRALGAGSLALAGLSALLLCIPHAPELPLHRADPPTLSHVAMASPVSVAGRPTTVVHPLSCTQLPDVPGKSLSTILVEFPPNAFTGPHRHPGSVSAFVVSGAVRSQLAGGPAIDYAAGQTWFEPPMTLHAFAENRSAVEPATLLVTFIADDGCRELVIPEHSLGKEARRLP